MALGGCQSVPVVAARVQGVAAAAGNGWGRCGCGCVHGVCGSRRGGGGSLIGVGLGGSFGVYVFGGGL